MPAQATPHFPLVAVDVGNSRVKIALFETPPSTAPGALLAAPTASTFVVPGVDRWETVLALLGGREPNAFAWRIGSVQRKVSAEFVEQLRSWNASRITLLSVGDLPLTVSLPRPDMVGIDRLLGAVAANQARTPGQPAVIVHMGTAVTVNLVSATGAFLGGAILPGIAMSARALHQFTDLLPLIDMQALGEAPPAVGTSTVPAMTAGLFWGAVGGVKELIDRMSRHVGGEAEVFLTGGAAPSVASLLPGRARYEPDLVPLGIAIAAARGACAS